MVFWAANFIVVKSAISVLPPVGFTFLRYAIAGITLLALLRWREGAIRLPAGDIRTIFVLGAVGFGCYQILWTVGLQTVPAGDSALLIATTPVVTALLAMALGADTPNVVKLVGAFISFFGVALVIVAGQGLSLGVSIGGDLLTLGAAVCWAVYTVYGARILRRHSPLVTTTWAVLAGTLFLAPVGLAQLATTDLSQVGPPAIAGHPVLRNAGGRDRQRGRLPRGQDAGPDSHHLAPVPGPGDGRCDGGGVPGRADPSDPDRGRCDHPGRGRIAAPGIVAGGRSRGTVASRFGAMSTEREARAARPHATTARHPRSRRWSRACRRSRSWSTTTGRSR